MADELCILMVAAENDALPGGKVGGIGDVVRDVPPALVQLDDPICHVSIVVPSYGFLQRASGATLLQSFTFSFGGVDEPMELYEVPGRVKADRVKHYVLHHPAFETIDPATRKPSIYWRDPDTTPFATDATRFARFCAGVAEALKQGLFGAVNRLHLHDWHAAFLLLLIRCKDRFSELRALLPVYTIHNLALQGIRPLQGHPSSLQSWFPNLQYKVEEVIDPAYRDCINPAVVGIRFSDAVHAVSPGYREEILLPTIPRRGDEDAVFFGGEGLESDLQKADAEGRLFGILNGCNYDDRPMPPRDFDSYRRLLATLLDAVQRFRGRSPAPVHELAACRLEERMQDSERPPAILTAVSRLVSQKVRLMHNLPSLLGGLPPADLLIILGSGDPKLEEALFRLSDSSRNFLFLAFYDDPSAKALYENGDLFLMPSSFEPCGISQMLAMRDGQPCVVHSVGGLKDTVEDGVTGFCFRGNDPQAQAEHFVQTVFRARMLFCDQPERFETIRHAAFRKRFLWSDSVRQYAEKLYR